MKELAIFFFSIYSSPQPFMRDHINQLRATTYPIWTGASLTPGLSRKGDEHCRTAAGQGYSELFGGWIKLEDITPHAFYFIVSHITLFFPSFPLFFYSLNISPFGLERERLLHFPIIHPSHAFSYSYTPHTLTYYMLSVSSLSSCPFCITLNNNHPT